MLRKVFDEFERPGAHGLAGELGAKSLGRLATHDIAPMVWHEETEQARDLLLQGDRHGLRVRGRDRVERCILGIETRGVLVGGPLEREDHVISRQGAVAALALNVVAQLERPGLLVFGGRPTLREVRLDHLGADLPGLDANQAVEEPVHDIDVERCARPVGIERTHVAARHRDAQRLRAESGCREKRA